MPFRAAPVLESVAQPRAYPRQSECPTARSAFVNLAPSPKLHGGNRLAFRVAANAGSDGNRSVAVSDDERIMGEQPQRLGDRLRDQQSVERVVVMVRKVLDGRSVLWGDGQ
jgi:hypothetical protein